MSAIVRDHRDPAGEKYIRDMENGTWFCMGLEIYLKADRDCVVHAETGRRVAFNEMHKGTPVAAEIYIYNR